MYLRKVYKEWRGFFWLIIIAISTQLFFMTKGVSNIPFFLYHMYSYAHQPKDSFNVLLIKTKDGYLDPYRVSGRESEMLMKNIPYFMLQKNRGWKDDISLTVEKRFKNQLPGPVYDYLHRGLVNDTTAFLKYPRWWQQYFDRTYHQSFDTVAVISTYIKYQPNFSKSPVDSTIFTAQFK